METIFVRTTKDHLLEEYQPKTIVEALNSVVPSTIFQYYEKQNDWLVVASHDENHPEHLVWIKICNISNNTKRCLKEIININNNMADQWYEKQIKAVNIGITLGQSFRKPVYYANTQPLKDKWWGGGRVIINHLYCNNDRITAIYVYKFAKVLVVKMYNSENCKKYHFSITGYCKPFKIFDKDSNNCSLVVSFMRKNVFTSKQYYGSKTAIGALEHHINEIVNDNHKRRECSWLKLNTAKYFNGNNNNCIEMEGKQEIISNNNNCIEIEGQEEIINNNNNYIEMEEKQETIGNHYTNDNNNNIEIEGKKEIIGNNNNNSDWSYDSTNEKINNYEKYFNGNQMKEFEEMIGNNYESDCSRNSNNERIRNAEK